MKRKELLIDKKNLKYYASKISLKERTSVV